MDETLLEFADSRGLPLAVDRESGVIRGVKILGRESRNGRLYPSETLVQARELYEGAKVNVNHPKGSPLGPRDYQDRIGVIRNVSIAAESGLFGDLHFNPRHALAAQLTWDAEHAPENVGLSHNVLARTARRDERVVVEAITKVLSVDLVADPATTHGLYEATQNKAGEEAGGNSQEANSKDPTVASATVEEVRRLRPDLAEALAAADRAEVERLRAELTALREAALQKPRSRDQQLVEAAAATRREAENDTAAFVKAVRG